MRRREGLIASTGQSSGHVLPRKFPGQAREVVWISCYESAKNKKSVGGPEWEKCDFCHDAEKNIDW